MILQVYNEILMRIKVERVLQILYIYFKLPIRNCLNTISMGFKSADIYITANHCIQNYDKKIIFTSRSIN